MYAIIAHLSNDYGFGWTQKNSIEILNFYYNNNANISLIYRNYNFYDKTITQLIIEGFTKERVINWKLNAQKSVNLVYGCDSVGHWS